MDKCAWCIILGLQSVRGFFSWRSWGWGRTPQWTKKVLKKMLLSSSGCNSSAWREDGKRSCLLEGQPAGKEARKVLVFISSNGFASSLQQIFLLPAGFQRGYISFREQEGTSVCAVCGWWLFFFPKFLNLCEKFC